MKLEKELMDIDILMLDEIRKKFQLMDINNASFNMINYVKYLIKNVNIEIFGRDMCSADKLIYDRKLEGYCFETTSILIPYFNDTDYISRGNLYFTGESDSYFHSWINFSLHGCDYVFDPTLSLLCLKNMYEELFNIGDVVNVSSLKVRDELICFLNKGNEFMIYGSDKLEDSFYGNDVKVRGKVKKNMIRRLDVSY